MVAKRTEFADARKAAGYTQERLAEILHVERSTVIRWEAGATAPQPYLRPKLARILQVSPARLVELLAPGSGVVGTTLSNASCDEIAALELADRVSASDVSDETLCRLEDAVDDLAVSYSMTPPDQLLARAREYIDYVVNLLNGRMTLAGHRRLITVGGWLSLLAGTIHLDLKQEKLAMARLRTADHLAKHVEHAEIRAWVSETTAWRALLDGEYARSLELARQAQSRAPKGSSVAIQATAQEGRALARLNQSKATYVAISRVHRLVAPRTTPDRPEHHYRYDPNKSVAYTATTLAWAGDPAAEAYAREVLSRLEFGSDASKWPRRVVSANLDLAFALVAADRLDEACYATSMAMISGRMVPSHYWRATEVITAVESRNVPEAKELREVYQQVCRTNLDSGRSGLVKQV